jgi:hypothetical protein
MNHHFTSTQNYHFELMRQQVSKESIMNNKHNVMFTNQYWNSHIAIGRMLSKSLAKIKSLELPRAQAIDSMM